MIYKLVYHGKFMRLPKKQLFVLFDIRQFWPTWCYTPHWLSTMSYLIRGTIVKFTKAKVSPNSSTALHNKTIFRSKTVLVNNVLNNGIIILVNPVEYRLILTDFAHGGSSG